MYIEEKLPLYQQKKTPNLEVVFIFHFFCKKVVQTGLSTPIYIVGAETIFTRLHPDIYLHEVFR